MKIIDHVNMEYSEDGTDYEYVTVELDGEVIAEYGDYCHDKGMEKAEAFIRGWYAGRSETDQEPSYETRHFNEHLR